MNSSLVHACPSSAACAATARVTRRAKAQRMQGRPPLPAACSSQPGKRTLEIAAAGRHSPMLIGPPGTGKAALVACLPGLSPVLVAPAEALEISMIHCVAGMFNGGHLLRRPPFRAPSSGMSPTALLGSGRGAGLGEACLAHLGVLFLNELFLFPPVSGNAGPAAGGHQVRGLCSYALMSQGASPPRPQLVAAMSPTRSHASATRCAKPVKLGNTGATIPARSVR